MFPTNENCWFAVVRYLPVHVVWRLPGWNKLLNRVLSSELLWRTKSEDEFQLLHDKNIITNYRYYYLRRSRNCYGKLFDGNTGEELGFTRVRWLRHLFHYRLVLNDSDLWCWNLETGEQQLIETSVKSIDVKLNHSSNHPIILLTFRDNRRLLLQVADHRPQLVLTRSVVPSDVLRILIDTHFQNKYTLTSNIKGELVLNTEDRTTVILSGVIDFEHQQLFYGKIDLIVLCTDGKVHRLDINLRPHHSDNIRGIDNIIELEKIVFAPTIYHPFGETILRRGPFIRRLDGTAYIDEPMAGDPPLLYSGIVRIIKEEAHSLIVARCPIDD